MKLLFITNHFLDVNSGGTFASRAFANAFAELSEQCILLYPDRNTDISQHIHFKYVKKGVLNDKSNFRKLLDFYLGRIHRYSKQALFVIKEFQPDLVVFDNSRCSAGLIKKLKKLDIKVITIHHNFEMQYYKGTPPSIFWRIPFMLYMKNTEEKSIKFSDLNLALTSQDIKLLRSNYKHVDNASFEKIGCFESEFNNFKDVVEKRQTQLTFVITGSLSSYQTEVSLLKFLEKFYPIILKNYPESRLVIAGNNPSVKIKNLCLKFQNIVLIPNPDSIQTIMNMSDIYICPISVGGGMKLRIMEGLKAGLPVLSHTVSERGYDEFKNLNVFFSYHLS